MIVVSITITAPSRGVSIISAAVLPIVTVVPAFLSFAVIPFITLVLRSAVLSFVAVIVCVPLFLDVFPLHKILLAARTLVWLAFAG